MKININNLIIKHIYNKYFIKQYKYKNEIKYLYRIPEEEVLQTKDQAFILWTLKKTNKIEFIKYMEWLYYKKKIINQIFCLYFMEFKHMEFKIEKNNEPEEEII